MQLTSHELQILRDELSRAAIRDTLFRYCRGVDRADPDIISSAFHPGARDDHGQYRGTIEEFVGAIVPRIRESYIGLQHFLGNISIELNAEVARVESYFRSTLRYQANPDTISTFGGRYLDRFERRGGNWLIARRTVVHDWSWRQAVPQDISRIAGYANGSTNQYDPLYQATFWDNWHSDMAE